MGRSTPTTAFDGAIDTLLIQCRHIEHMHEGVWFNKKCHSHVTNAPKGIGQA